MIPSRIPGSTGAESAELLFIEHGRRLNPRMHGPERQKERRLRFSMVSGRSMAEEALEIEELRLA